MACCAAGSAANDNYVPRGKIIKRLVDTYESTATHGLSTRGTLLLLPDGFGLAQHNLMLADQFAEQGWRVIIPDYFEGDPLPTAILREGLQISTNDELDTIMGAPLTSFNIAGWMRRHSHARVAELLRAVLALVINDHDRDKLVTVGYCFGGKHALRLAHGVVSAAIIFHPSFVEKSDVMDVCAPLLAGLAQHDTMVSKTLASDLQTWSTSRTGSPPEFVVEVFSDVGHGFAARPDSKDEMALHQCGAAFARAVDFLDQHAPE